jgi:F-type H+-transporting ATPase subunit alpha
MKSIAGTLRLDLAQYRSMAAFAQFASDLDAKTRAQLDRGARLVEILKQGQYVPLPVEKQILIIFAGTSGLLDDLPVSELRRFEEELYKFVESKHPTILPDIVAKKVLDDDLKARMKAAIEAFKKKFVHDAGQAGGHPQASGQATEASAKKAAAATKAHAEDEEEEEGDEEEEEEEDEEPKPKPKTSGKKGK